MRQYNIRIEFWQIIDSDIRTVRPIRRIAADMLHCENEKKTIGMEARRETNLEQTGTILYFCFTLARDMGNNISSIYPPSRIVQAFSSTRDVPEVSYSQSSCRLESQIA